MSPSSSRSTPTLLLLLLAAPLSLAWTTIPRPQRTNTGLHVLSDPSSSVAVASSALATLDSFWQTDPYAAAAIACGFKASAADMVAQKNPPVEEEKKEELIPALSPALSPATDYKRNAAFLLYGSLYQGISQEFIYNHLYPVWFGSGNEIPVVLTKVAFDLLVQTTLVTLPMAYCIKGAIFGTNLQESLTKYWKDVQTQGLLQKYFTLWGPVQCLTFGVVPEHYRVTFIAVVSFFWLIILSQISSKGDDIVETTASLQSEEAM